MIHWIRSWFCKHEIAESHGTALRDSPYWSYPAECPTTLLYCKRCGWTKWFWS